MLILLKTAMRILIGAQNYPPTVNGPAAFTAHLAEGLAQRGHEVTVAAPSETGRGQRTRRNGVTLEGIRSLGLPGRPEVRVTPFPGARLQRMLDRCPPDIIHLQDHYPIAWSLARLARSAATPLLATNHFLAENVTTYLPALFDAPPFRWALWRFVLSVLGSASLVTVPTRTGAVILRQAGMRGPLQPVSCGVDTDHFRVLHSVDIAAVRHRHGLALDAPVALYLGRLEPEKELPVLLRAMACPGAPAALQLAVAGTGGAADRLRSEAEKLGLDGRVVFLGPIGDDAHVALLNSVDLFVMPSPAELESIATLEAMAAGRPVLAADAGALPELVDQGNGARFAAGDPQDAANALAALLRQRDAWPGMGAESRRRALRRSFARTVEKYEGLYQSLIHRSRHGPPRAAGPGAPRR